jgi:hypothetical protein
MVKNFQLENKIGMPALQNLLIILLLNFWLKITGKPVNKILNLTDVPLKNSF